MLACLVILLIDPRAVLNDDVIFAELRFATNYPAVKFDLFKSARKAVILKPFELVAFCNADYKAYAD
jgi:hypothetical protein